MEQDEPDWIDHALGWFGSVNWLAVLSAGFAALAFVTSGLAQESRDWPLLAHAGVEGLVALVLAVLALGDR